jgi:hypothetical protein
MNRIFRGALLIAFGILLGVASSTFQQTKADAPSSDDAIRTQQDILAELKEIKSQLKSTDSYLRTGIIRNFAVMNPPPGTPQ